MVDGFQQTVVSKKRSVWVSRFLSVKTMDEKQQVLQRIEDGSRQD